MSSGLEKNFSWCYILANWEFCVLTLTNLKGIERNFRNRARDGQRFPLPHTVQLGLNHPPPNIHDLRHWNNETQLPASSSPQINVNRRGTVKASWLHSGIRVQGKWRKQVVILGKLQSLEFNMWCERVAGDSKAQGEEQGCGVLWHMSASQPYWGQSVGFQGTCNILWASVSSHKISIEISDI